LKQFLVMLEALITLILVLVAIAGIAYHSFREGGLLSQGFGKISYAYLNYPLAALAVTITAFMGIRAWRNRKLHDKPTRFFDYMIYALMAVGIYFVGRYVISGQF